MPSGRFMAEKSTCAPEGDILQACLEVTKALGEQENAAERRVLQCRTDSRSQARA